MATALSVPIQTPGGSATHVEVDGVTDDAAAGRARIAYRLGTLPGGTFAPMATYQHDVVNRAAVLGFDGSVAIPGAADYDAFKAANPGGLTDAVALARLAADGLVSV